MACMVMVYGQGMTIGTDFGAAIQRPRPDMRQCKSQIVNGTAQQIQKREEETGASLFNLC